MKLRESWKILAILCAGCQSMVAVNVPTKALQLWQKGQVAKQQGDVQRATSYYKQSLAEDEALTQNHLSLASALLEKGDEAGACPHLEKYLDRHPENLQVRSYLAELLIRQERRKDARAHLEQYIALAQAESNTLREQIQVHCRLMELAEAEENDYELHLHRGIGMYLLALRRSALSDDDVELNAEGLLCKAAAELVHAATLREDEARPCWYLYAVWWRLAQQHSAHQWLQRAQESAPFSFLTPAERRQLTLAAQQPLEVR